METSANPDELETVAAPMNEGEGESEMAKPEKVFW